MLERFTDTARRVVVHAQEEARALEHGHIGTEHLLLGLLRGDTDGAVRALGAAGLTLDTARHDIEELVGRGSAAPGSEMPFTARAKKVLELSLREALQFGDDYIRSEHLLLGLMREPEGTGAQVLQRRGIDVFDLRGDVVAALRGPEPRPEAPRTADRPEPPAAGSPEPRVTGRPESETASPDAAVEERLTAIERRLERIERLLRDGRGPGSA
ncbi:MAG: Clp protease N-terminal domain-containing protein [Actinoallomurus sp.]